MNWMQCCRNVGHDSGKIDLFGLYNVISDVYNTVVMFFSDLASNWVPLVQKDFYKYWWDQELSALKEECVTAHEAWKNAGKPNAGELFETKEII